MPRTTLAPITITLTPMERAVAGLVANTRHEECLRMGLKNKYGAEDERSLDYDILGALGEMAFAKGLNVYWDCAVNTFKSRADVGKYEVRLRVGHNRDLIIRPDDDPERIYALVTTDEFRRKFKIWGCVIGKDAMQKKYFLTPNNRPRAYFFPKEELTPLEQQKESLESYLQ